MTDEENNQGQALPDPDATIIQTNSPASEYVVSEHGASTADAVGNQPLGPSYAPQPPPFPGTPPSIQPQPPYPQSMMTGEQGGFAAPMPPPPYIPQQPQPPYSQPASMGDMPAGYTPVPPPYMAQQQPYSPSASTGGIPAGYTPAPPPYMQQQTYPQQMVTGGMPGSHTPMPPPYMQPPIQKKSNKGLKILLAVLAVIVVLGASGGGIAIYLLTRPQPVITMTSDYRVGTTPAGSTTTGFHILGHKFSGSEMITFLLDGAPAPGSQAVRSDKDGNVVTDLTVNDSWSLGDHLVTAKDTDGYTTKVSTKLTIVTQGQAHTPGPNGAPPDDTTGVIVATVQTSDQSTTGAQNNTATQNLHITGHPDPAGGTVCGDNDDGQPVVHTSTTNGIVSTVTLTQTCSGTYKAGRLTYTETVTSAKFTFAKNGITILCTVKVPFVNLQMEGRFTSASAINGTATSDSIVLNCDHGLGSNTIGAQSGTWTGTM